ncbi:vacuolar import and degradation protein-domain-containing protein [Crassisporium funariophilum]|nr:vacuolar import and degradation protein-domain-containing protein [Crassisporium funariophilum]
MPANHSCPPHTDHQHQQDQQPQQAKVCSTCNSTLVDPTLIQFHHDPEAVVCLACRERNAQLLSPATTPTPESRQHRIDPLSPYLIRQTAHEAPILHSTRRNQDTLTPAFDTAASTLISSLTSSEQTHSYHGSPSHSSSYSKKSASLSIQCNIITSSNPPRHQSLPLVANSYEATSSRQHSSTPWSPDPFADITRLRIRSRGHHCLYPGASFQGTQKSGRNSYDVNVTIVDVNFAESTLCGYLRIRGLTDDWPELTTYFDAEIIGSRYGFLTQNWGANHHEDMVHWSRFPAFKHIRHEAQRPHLTIEDRDRGAVFMRWKERFLVPDHRVQDINGASFAGFYYVCVDFNPPAAPASPLPTTTARSSSQPAPITVECEEHQILPPSLSGKGEARQRSRRDSSVRRRGPSLTPLAPTVATMSGFYYHQNSEPYQQLSLTHVPERTSSSFEFR